MSYLIEDETRLHVAHGLPYRIQFFVDGDPIPPWEWDGSVPMVTLHGDRGYRRFDTRPTRAYDLLNPIPFLSDRAIRANLSEIADMAGYADAAALDDDALHYYGRPIAAARRMLLKYDFLGDGEVSADRMDAIARLWNIAGVPAERFGSYGCSQGDYADLLVVAHPEAVRAFGFKNMRAYRKACQNDLQSAADEWGAWAWGNVIGYHVDMLDLDEWQEEGCPDDARTLNRLDGEHVDSCWGFYPESSDSSYPLDKHQAHAISEAISAAEYHAAGEAERRAVALADAIAESRPDMAAGDW